MTEYDYSEEGYQRYMQTLNRVSDWVDGTNAARSRYAHAVHPPTQSTPSQVATRSRTRERSQSASYSYPQHAYHSQQNLHPYDVGGGGARAGAQGAPPPRMQPTRSKTMDVSAGRHLQYTHRHVYDKQPQTQPQTQTHTRSGSRSSSRHPSPPNNSSHVSSHTTTPHHSRSASRVTSPVSASTTARQQFPPAQPYKPPPQTQQTQARHVRSSSAEPTAIRTRSRSYSYSGPSPAPAPTPRPIPVPQPVSAVLPRREPRRSNTMPPGHHHHVYDHTGKERNVLRKSYDYVPGVGVGTGMTRGGTYVAVPPGYSARVMDVRSTTPSKQPPHRPLLKRIFTSFKN